MLKSLAKLVAEVADKYPDDKEAAKEFIRIASKRKSWKAIKAYLIYRGAMKLLTEAAKKRKSEKSRTD